MVDREIKFYIDSIEKQKESTYCDGGYLLQFPDAEFLCLSFQRNSFTELYTNGEFRKVEKFVIHPLGQSLENIVENINKEENGKSTVLEFPLPIISLQ